MTKTLRRRDLNKPVHDGKCWRGCDGSYCPICSGNRTNKKDKEKKKLDEITEELLDKYCGKKFFNLLAEDN